MTCGKIELETGEASLAANASFHNMPLDILIMESFNHRTSITSKIYETKQESGKFFCNIEVCAR